MIPPRSNLLEPWRAPFGRGLDALRAGDFTTATDCFERSHRLAPERAEIAYALGRERMRAGRYEEAESLLEKAWAMDRSLLSAAAALARCLGLHMKRFARGREILDDAHRSAENDDERALILVVRAELHLEEGQFDAARDAARTALTLAAPDTTTRDAACAALARVENQDGVELSESGKTEASLFAFKRATACDPEWSAPRVNMGVAFAKLARFEQARRCYLEALDIDPQNPAAHANLGRLYLNAGDLWQALACFEAALALDPTDTATMLAMARTAKKLNT